MIRYSLVLALLALVACEQRSVPEPTVGPTPAPAAQETAEMDAPIEKITKTDEQWRAQLTEQQFEVARKAGTERAFTGAYWDTKTRGVYKCVCCDLPLFASETKYDSGSGWPAYYQPIDPKHIVERRDTRHGMVRTEVLCARCDAHLGHVFNDGPKPTGMRYCINSVSMTLDPAETEPR